MKAGAATTSGTNFASWSLILTISQPIPAAQTILCTGEDDEISVRQTDMKSFY